MTFIHFRAIFLVSKSTFKQFYCADYMEDSRFMTHTKMMNYKKNQLLTDFFKEK